MSDPAAEILVVDDDSNDCGLALAAFARVDPAPRVVAVDGGAEALAYLFCTGAHSQRADRSLPKLVILDINMPQMSGLAVLRAIRADVRTEDLSVIILTGSYDPQEIEQAVKLGATSYFIKPADLEEYMDMLQIIRESWL
jgi:two-component system response regulator